jgi:glycerophosphoryl diester phosphodiesterase
MIQLVGTGEEWDHFLTPDGLDRITAYAQGIGPSHHRLVSRESHEALPDAASLVHRAHASGLSVLSWTLCPENAFLPVPLRRGHVLADHGDAQGQAELLLGLGVDGLITDAPDIAVQARAAMTLPLAA